MAASLLLSPPPLSSSPIRHLSSPPIPAFRYHVLPSPSLSASVALLISNPFRDLVVLRRTERTKMRNRYSAVVVSSSPASSSSFVPVPEDPPRYFQRRDLLLSGLSISLLLVLPISDVHAEIQSDEDFKAALLVDDINAYSFLYPVELPTKKFAFKWIESRKPERYSSAAPLSANARQRIVSERVDMIHNLVISVSIGPPNSRFLTSNDKKTWDAKNVADSVLSDKSALPVTTGQKMAESSVLDAHSEDVDGEPYWYYEYLVRKSPTKFGQGSNLFRHNVSATAERDGYLYSLNASALSKQWESIGPFLQKTVKSFKLIPPTENYVPPYKDPWRFW